MRLFLEDLLKDAVIYINSAKRKTITTREVVLALRRQGHILYGFA